MQQVITEKQARQITGGRKPLVPVVYEQAVKALAECLTLDDAKIWDNKADALAAWAKIYKSDQAGIEARKLKLHAYRRMGLLAQELRPTRRRSVGAGSLPGPVSLLQEHGFSNSRATSISRLAKLPKKRFDEFVSSNKPPSINLALNLASGSSESWNKFSGNTAVGLMSARSFIRKFKASELANGMTKSEAALARAAAIEMTEWLDEFERCLPK